MLGWLVHRWASLGVQHGYVDKFFPVSNLASLEAGWAVGEGLGSGPISIACDLGGSPPGCFPICEMGTRKCHSRVSWVFNRGLWLRCWNSPGDWEAHLFCTIQSRQMTQISLTLLNIKVRKKLSLKHLSWGKQPLEYESFFFQVQTRANYQWSQNGVGFFFFLVWLLHWNTSDTDLNINCSARNICGRKAADAMVRRKHFDYMGWKCFHNFLLKP